MAYIFERKFVNVPIYHMIITEDILVFAQTSSAGLV